MQPRYSHALVGCVRNDSRCGTVCNMAAKKKATPTTAKKTSIVSAPQKSKAAANSAKGDLAEERTVMRQINKFNKGQKKIGETPRGTGMFAYPHRTDKGKLIARVANYTSTKPNTFPKVSGYATGQKKPKKK